MGTRCSVRRRAAIRLQVAITFVALNVLSGCSDSDVSELPGAFAIASRFDDLNCTVSDLSGFSLAIPPDYVRQEIKADQSTRVDFSRMRAQLEEGVVNPTEFDSIHVYDFRIASVEEYYNDISPSFDVTFVSKVKDIDIYKVAFVDAVAPGSILLLNGMHGAVALTGEPALRWRDVVFCETD